MRSITTDYTISICCNQVLHAHALRCWLLPCSPDLFSEDNSSESFRCLMIERLMVHELLIFCFSVSYPGNLRGPMPLVMHYLRGVLLYRALQGVGLRESRTPNSSTVRLPMIMSTQCTLPTKPTDLCIVYTAILAAVGHRVV